MDKLLKDLSRVEGGMWAIGLAVGVSLSVALESWAFVALAPAFAVALSEGAQRSGKEPGDGQAPGEDGAEDR